MSIISLGSIVVAFGAILGIYWMVSSYKFKNSAQYKILRQLTQLDYNDGKKSAYRFCALVRQLELTSREERLFEEIIELLSEYKYRPISKPLPRAIRAKIELFIEGLS